MASETPPNASAARVSPAQRTAAGLEADRNAVADAERRERWYGKYASIAEWTYRILVFFQLAFAAAVPVSAAVHAAEWIPAVLGATAAVLTGIQQTLGLGQDYVRLSATHVAIERELRLYRALAGPYADDPAPAQLLALRVEDAVTQDTARWTSQRTKSDEGTEGTRDKKGSR